MADPPAVGTAPNRNALWARALTEELVRSGVREAVISPGSRSTPLALACAEHPELRIWSVLDERVAGFFALGLGKASRLPALVVVTSGSAGAHLLPAAIEAAESGVPLLLATADRPPELHGWGAPQTIPQNQLFAGFARWTADLGTPEISEAGLRHLRATGARAVAVALGQLGAAAGPVHLNAPFREPLAPTPEPGLNLSGLSSAALLGRETGPITHFPAASRSPDEYTLQRLAIGFAAEPRGVIVCGPRAPDPRFRAAVLRLGDLLGYPVLAEATSGVRFGMGPDPGLALPVAHYDALLRHPGFGAAARPRVVLRFGRGLTSKVLSRWLDGSGARVVLFSDQGLLFDPGHSAEEFVLGDAAAACEELVELADEAWASATAARSSRPSPPPTAWDHPPRPMLGEGDRAGWLTLWLDAEHLAGEAIANCFAADPRLTEPRIAREVRRALRDGTPLLVANSMPIRDADAWMEADGAEVLAFENRGANGIDGLVATTLGLGAALGRTPVLLIGDVALVHDIGAMLEARRQGAALVVVLVNNDGGGIFNFLPIAEHPRHFETLFGTPHGTPFARAAALAGAEYVCPDTPEALRAAIAAGLAGGGRHLIELRTERGGNVAEQRALQRAVATALDASGLVAPAH